MEADAIFGPMFAVMLLTIAVWVFMFARRIHFLTANQIDSRDLERPGALAELTPAHVSNPSDNLKNLFEMPVLFYALVAYLFATSRVDAFHVWAAWIFALFRVAHSVVHCTFNRVMLRFYLYAASCVALFAMIAREAWRTLVG